MKIAMNSMPYQNMTVREYAAIHLSVPDSGDAELDMMIRKANRARVASHAMAAQMTYAETHDPSPEGVAKWAAIYADALLSALEINHAAIAAADGTLHGAIDYWQDRAIKAEHALSALEAKP